MTGLENLTTEEILVTVPQTKLRSEIVIQNKGIERNFDAVMQDLGLIASSSLLAFIIFIILTPWFTKQLIKLKFGKQIRDIAISGEKSTLFSELHAHKKGTPTMGGLLIWGSILMVVLISLITNKLGLFNHSLLSREETYIPLFTLVTCGILGAVDDYLNIKGIGKTKGLSAKLKLFWLTIFSAIGAWWFYSKLGYTSIRVPFLDQTHLDLGILIIPFFIMVITATANAVNFTDGLDGLASGLLIFAFGAFGILAFAKGLFILAALCGVISGAILAFLWFNVTPAQFIMGDTGAIGLGATLGVIAMLTDHPLALPVIGFVFVMEFLSVIIQLTSKKLFKRKVFLIAPIHHHFEAKGWTESRVVMRFWIMGGIATVIGTIVGLMNFI